MENGKPVLQPIERVSEVLFGLIMVLTFTGSLSVAEAGKAEVRDMLIGALGCNVVWGIIDAVFYLMGCLAERARGVLIARSVRDAASPDEARAIIADALPPVAAASLGPEALDRICEAVTEMPLPSAGGLGRDDWRGASGIFLLVFLSTFPVTLPFIFIGDAFTALRLSNAIAIAMLFALGYVFGHLTGRQPIVTALLMVVFGVILVALTIALGG